MPRRAIIIMLVVLIVGIIGGSVALLLGRFGTTGQLAQATPSTNATPGKCDATDPTLDADSDGLLNGDEKLWGSDACNPDTDGDGFKDGEEIKNGHNPTIAAPNDVVPAGFVPGRGVAEPGSGTSTPAPTPDTRNFTDEYNKQVPAADQTDATLAKFVEQQPVDTTLPTIADSTITILPNNNGDELGHYIGIVDSQIELLQPQELNLAMNNLIQYANTDQATSLLVKIRDFSKTIHSTPVPPVATSFHRFFLGYIDHIANSLADAVKWTTTDQVRSRVAMNQIQATYVAHWPTIQQEYLRINQALHSL